jgi:hypothetical protein
MHLVREFRRHAQDCRRMADLSRSNEDKECWNKLAERWLRCADNLEHEERRPEQPERAPRRAPRKDGRIARRRQQAA